jgi:hypothetical protein
VSREAPPVHPAGDRRSRGDQGARLGPSEAPVATDSSRPLMYRLAKAAEVTGLSEDFLRRVPDLPKVVIRGTGSKDRRPIVGILYDDLVAWLHAQRQG